MNIQDEIQKIHSQFGISEVANYKIQLLFDEYGVQMYNQAIEDAVQNVRTEEPLRMTESMAWNNVSPRDYVFFKPDKESILKLKK